LTTADVTIVCGTGEEARTLIFNQLPPCSFGDCGVTPAYIFSYKIKIPFKSSDLKGILYRSLKTILYQSSLKLVKKPKPKEVAISVHNNSNLSILYFLNILFKSLNGFDIPEGTTKSS
jgi:hypothetical protein